MADNREVEGTISRGNEWEVVSLTASAYAAAPGPDQVELSENENKKENDNTVDKDEAETSHAMFMSGHFVVPPSQHKNLPSEPEKVEVHNAQEGVQTENTVIHNVQGVEEIDDVVPEHSVGKGAISDTKGEENWNIEGLTVPDEFSGIQFFDEKGKGTDYEGGSILEGLNLMEKEQSIYSAAEFSSFHETTMGGSVMYEEETVISESIERSDQGLDSEISPLPKPTNEDKNEGSDLPCEAWWKRQAASLYAHAKEANTVWSIFIAAAVMGLVIIGQRWQKERQVLQLKWQYSVNDEKMGRVLGPVSRFKDVFIGNNRWSSFIRDSSTTGR